MRYMRYMLAASLLPMLVACSGGDRNGDAAVPRQRAYPRIEVPDSVFRPVDLGGVPVEVNCAAEVSLTRSDASGTWADITYPRLGASIHLTVTPCSTPEQRNSVIDNRMERIELNLGAAQTSTEQIEGVGGRGEYSYRVFATRDIVTPVQFIASDFSNHVISGTAYMPAASVATTDSLAPIFKMLRRDIIHAMNALP